MESRVRPTLTGMEESTAEDWAIIGKSFVEHGQGLADRVLGHLGLLDGDFGGFAVDRLTHSLQTATRAFRAGEDEEYVVCALLHDIGDTLGTFNHPDIAAAILKPFVSEANLWMVEKHGVFQGYYFFHHIGLDRNMRDQLASHPYYERTRLFSEKYDNVAFDPTLECRPLQFFERMVRRVLAKPVRSIYLKWVSAFSSVESRLLLMS